MIAQERPALANEDQRDLVEPDAGVRRRILMLAEPFGGGLLRRFPVRRLLGEPAVLVGAARHVDEHERSVVERHQVGAAAAGVGVGVAIMF